MLPKRAPIWPPLGAPTGDTPCDLPLPSEPQTLLVTPPGPPFSFGDPSHPLGTPKPSQGLHLGSPSSLRDPSGEPSPLLGAQNPLGDPPGPFQDPPHPLGIPKPPQGSPNPVESPTPPGDKDSQPCTLGGDGKKGQGARGGPHPPAAGVPTHIQALAGLPVPLSQGRQVPALHLCQHLPGPELSVPGGWGSWGWGGGQGASPTSSLLWRTSSTRSWGARSAPSFCRVRRGWSPQHW